jgi:carbon storage regulator
VLVVTRKRNEAIVIGDGIEVRVLRVGRDGVRLGITAPPHISVHRSEIYDQIRAANSAAAVSSVGSGSVDWLRSRMIRPPRHEDKNASHL